MTEFVKHMAEVEGVRTPARKRSKKEVEAAFEDYTKKRTAKPKAKTAQSAKSASGKAKAAPKAKAKKADAPVAEVAAAAIERIPVTENRGNLSSAGYDEASQKMHVEFSAGSVYEYATVTATEWDGLKATFADKETDSGSYFRKNFRGRKYRKLPQPIAAKAASAETSGEVSK